MLHLETVQQIGLGLRIWQNMVAVLCENGHDVHDFGVAAASAAGCLLQQHAATGNGYKVGIDGENM